VAPLLLSFVLTPMLENAVRQSFSISGGDIGIFVRGPITITILSLIVLFILSPMILKFFKKEKMTESNLFNINNSESDKQV
jgi:putative tricarboxylic transport membrane protein